MKDSANISRPTPHGLPPAVRRAQSRPLSPLRLKARAFAKSLVGSHPVLLAARTGSRIDTGSWFRKGRLSLLCLADRLVLLSPGRRPYAQGIPFSHLRQSLYNHVTGQLVLAPAEKAAVKSVAISPAMGYRVLAQIYSEVQDNA